MLVITALLTHLPLLFVLLVITVTMEPVLAAHVELETCVPIQE